MCRRRSMIIAGIAMFGGLGIGGCEKRQKTTKHERNRKMLTKISSDELQLLSNRKKEDRLNPGKRLKISGKTFDLDNRFDHFEWINVDFENCDFINCTMYGGVLRNVNFVDCLFFANNWDDEFWIDVSFQACAWRGPFDMGAPKGEGELKFVDCEFVGATEEELGYGGRQRLLAA